MPPITKRLNQPECSQKKYFMTKILYWNIEKFSINKINDPSTKRKDRSLPSGVVASGNRSDLILNVMQANTPDIFVIIETTTGAGAEGTLINTGGGQAALDLLQKIRTKFGVTWMLVPPLIIGQSTLKEGVCVFFNSSSNLFFTGPFGWEGGVNPANVIGGGTTVAYAAPWDTALPAVKTPTTAGIINGGLRQNQLAGQWLYDDGASPAVKLEFPSAGERPPYLTTFWDAGSNRNIKLLAYHAPPPETKISAAGVDSLSKIREITTLLGAQDDVIIMGDFNVNLSEKVLADEAYDTLIADSYTRQINPTAVSGFPDQGYICTTLYGTSGKNKAEPTDTRGYPAYGYMTQNSYDNMLTRYGDAVRVPVSSKITIVNLVTGSPYTKPTTPAYAGVKGTLIYTTAMETDRTAADPLAPVALLLPPDPTPNGNGGYAPNTKGVGPKFREWENYGVVRSTSDHMALIIDF
jgi:hypothetical protein